MGVEFTIARRPAQLPDTQRGVGDRGGCSAALLARPSTIPLEMMMTRNWVDSLVGRIDGQSDLTATPIVDVHCRSLPNCPSSGSDQFPPVGLAIPMPDVFPRSGCRCKPKRSTRIWNSCLRGRESQKSGRLGARSAVPGPDLHGRQIFRLG
jgi:hypothetical protein